MDQNTISALLSQAKEMKSELDSLRPISAEQERRIIDKFRLDWNYHSNHIEWNSYTYGETKMLILHGITSWWKPLRDGLEIKWHNEVLLWLLDIVHGDYPITEVFIRELNQKILWEPYELDAITPEWLPTKRLITPGQYKKQPNHVITKTGEIFRFAEPFEIVSKMNDLIDWFRWEQKTPETDPIFLATEFHYRFIRIHPFDDGNGRTARILMNFILMQYGYPPAIIRTDEKEWYYAALRQADVGDLSAFFEYITREVIRSLYIMIRWAQWEGIDDEDDLDKEIRLLKGEIQSDKKQKFSSKEEKIQFALENSIIPFVKYIFEGLDEFSDFYQYKPEKKVFYDWVRGYKHAQYGKTEIIESVFIRENEDVFLDTLPKEVIIEFLSELAFILNFRWLNLKVDIENYEIVIDISVKNENYFSSTIQTSNLNGRFLYTFQKTYIEKISEVETKQILNLIKKDHLEFIKSHKN